jgi:hypothetical protein
MVELACEYGRYVNRSITGLPRAEGFAVSHKRVERLRRRECLMMPPSQPRRGRPWLNECSCVATRITRLHLERQDP